MGEFLDLCLGVGVIERRIELDLEVFPLSDILDPLVADGLGGVVNGLPLRIEYAVLQGHIDFRDYYFRPLLKVDLWKFNKKVLDILPAIIVGFAITVRKAKLF